MADKGYIKLNRKFFQHPFWSEARLYSRAEAWLDLIQLARFEESTTEMLGGKRFELQRGELPASRRHLELRWGWGHSKVSTFLNSLCDLAMISRRQVAGQTIIKLLNYDTYNDSQTGVKTTADQQTDQGQAALQNEGRHTGKPPNGPSGPNVPEPDQCRTSDGPKPDQYKEGKERKKRNNIPIPTLSERKGMMVDFFSKIEIPDIAVRAQDIIFNELVRNGFSCEKEYRVTEREDGRNGRIDIFATKDGFSYAIEIDRLKAREKSVCKLKSIPEAMKIILLRGGGNGGQVDGIDLVYPVKVCSAFSFDFITDEVFRKHFDTWLEYKRQRRESYKTQMSLEMCYRKLVELSGNNPDTALLIIQQSMANNWAGLFALKGAGKAVAGKTDESKEDFLNRMLNKNRKV
jgi:hypothetical protein